MISSSWLLLYAAAFLGSFVLAVALTKVAQSLAHRLGLLDRPGGRKAHARPVALTGGWAIYATFALTVVGGGFLAPGLGERLPDSMHAIVPYLENLRGMRREILAVFIGATWIFALGAIDDVRPLGPWVKLAAQVASPLPLLWAGLGAHIFLPFPVLGWIATIAWIVLLLNSFNFMDNMDGLCATVAAMISVVLAIAAVQGGELVLPVLFLGFAGTLTGFLVFNFHPASIFLGDSGSLVVGYLLGVFSIMITYYDPEQATGLPVLIPVAVMGVPLFDTASVMLIRLKHGAPLYVGDQNHFSHRLQAMGFSVRQTAVTIGMLTAAIGLASLSLRYLALGQAIIHLLALFLLFCVVGAFELVGRRNSK